MEILVQNQSFRNIVCTQPTSAPSNSDEIMQQEQWIHDELALLAIYRFTHCTKLPRALLFMFPFGRGRIITIFHGFGTNCIVPSDWDSALRCVCGPNLISDLIGESPKFSAARSFESGAWHPAAFSSIAAHSSPFARLQNDPNSL